MLARVHQSGVVAVVGRVDHRFERVVEDVCERAEAEFSHRFQQRDVLVSDQDVGGVPVLPDQLLGVLKVDVAVAVDVHVLGAGERVGNREKVEQIVRKICDAVVLDGDVEHFVPGIGRGLVDFVGRAHAAILTERVRDKDEREILR